MIRPSRIFAVTSPSPRPSRRPLQVLDNAHAARNRLVAVEAPIAMLALAARALQPLPVDRKEPLHAGRAENMEAGQLRGAFLDAHALEAHGAREGRGRGPNHEPRDVAEIRAPARRTRDAA